MGGHARSLGASLDQEILDALNWMKWRWEVERRGRKVNPLALAKFGDSGVQLGDRLEWLSPGSDQPIAGGLGGEVLESAHVLPCGPSAIERGDFREKAVACKRPKGWGAEDFQNCGVESGEVSQAVFLCSGSEEFGERGYGFWGGVCGVELLENSDGRLSRRDTQDAAQVSLSERQKIGGRKASPFGQMTFVLQGEKQRRVAGPELRHCRFGVVQFLRRVRVAEV